MKRIFVIAFAVFQLSVPYLCAAVKYGLPAQNWCNYVSNSPEPDIIFYNRVPKCGSTTMVSIAETSCKSGRDCSVIGYPSKYWKPVITEKEKESIYKFASKDKRKSGIKVLHGHIPYFIFNASNVLNSQRMEFVQLYRNCADRYASSFFYDILDSLKAKTAKKKHEYNEFLISMFGTINWQDCITDKKCLLNSTKYKRMRIDEYWYYTVGHRACNASSSSLCKYREVESEAFELNFNPREGNYIAFGILEEMEKYLELLECIYPSVFTGRCCARLLCTSFSIV